MKQVHQYKILFDGYPKCNTYWCNLLETNQVSYQELARALGEDDYVIYKYCAGRDIPPRKIVSEICKYFKVDFLSGLQEFVKAHSNYIEQSNLKNYYSDKSSQTYWEKLRCDLRLSYDKIAIYAESNPTSMRGYFAGNGVPDDKTILKLCELFMVEFDVGKEQFINTFQTRHPDKKYRNYDKNKPRPIPPPNTKLRTYKDNFWSRLRVEKGISAKELAKLLGLNCKNPSELYNWFSGKHIPPDKHIRKFCEIYDVDYEKGKQEFINAHSQWYSWNHDIKKACIYTENQELYHPEKKTFSEHIPEIPTDMEVEQSKLNIRNKIFWNKIPPEIQETIRTRITDCKEQILNELYGEIDNYTYDATRNYLCSVVKIEEWIEPNETN